MLIGDMLFNRERERERGSIFPRWGSRQDSAISSSMPAVKCWPLQLEDPTDLFSTLKRRGGGGRLTSGSGESQTVISGNEQGGRHESKRITRVQKEEERERERDREREREVCIQKPAICVICVLA